MSDNDPGKFYFSNRSHSPRGVLWFLFFLIALSFAGNAYQYSESQKLARSTAAAERDMETQMAQMRAQITKLSDATSGGFDVAQQRFLAMQDAFGKATAEALRQAKSDAESENSKWTEAFEAKRQEYERKNQEALARLSQFKLETNAKLDRLAIEVGKNDSALKRLAENRTAPISDASTIRPSSKVAVRETPPSKPVPDRERLPFDLVRTPVPQKIGGEISLALLKADPKERRFTLDVYAGQKVTENRDRTIGETLPLYLSGRPEPYEVVVTEVKKDEVIGYVTAPKTKAPITQTVSDASPR